MATTAAYSADILMPSGGVNGGQAQWDYSVPVREDSFNRRSKSRTSHDSHRKSRDRNSKESRSSSISRQPYMQESNYNRNSSRGRRDHSRGRGSEAGSSKGVYGHESGSRSVGNVRESTNGAPHGLTEEAKWIHRDKLAKIESEELHQAALLFHRRPGIETKSSRGRSQATRQRGISESSETEPTEHNEPWPNMSEEQREYNNESPKSFEVNGAATGPHDERKTWDLRKPEEIAEEAIDDGASSVYRNPHLRKSSSRIPIPRTTTAPNLPIEARSRAQTIGDDVDASSPSRPRRASEPMTMDDSTPTPNGSRPNSRGANATMQSAGGRRPAAKSTQGSTNRKTSAPATSRKTTKSRTTSTANGTRPTARGDTRPTTAVNRPEGDPPWLATMYKPDPRLPPDQQIIPTHARQMMQQQWEKEGKTPTTYDRGFAPLAIASDALPSNNNNDNNEKTEEPPKEEQMQEKSEKPETEGNGTWPLSSSKSPDPMSPSTGTGYSPMPRVQDPPPAALTPKWSPPVVTAQEPPPPKEKKGGCGCCVVM